MNHFTVGHFLYFMGAIEGLAVIVMGIAVMNGRMPAADGTASPRTRGLILIFAGVATAIALCLFATFAEIAKQPIF
jgi:EamA domain-containing membrane protein RarD